MSTLSVTAPYPAFAGTDGLPLDNGYIWIGVANLSPQVNPISVYFDEALTILAVQPIRTSGGYPVYQGTPARLYVESNYSIQVLDSKGSVIYTLLSESVGTAGVFTSLTASGAVTFTGTGAAKLNVGTTVQRPTPATGMVRFNSSTGIFEGYGVANWRALGGGASGGGTDQVFYENDQTVNTDYTITAGTNAGTFGPITVASGVTVTVPSGSTWSVV